MGGSNASTNRSERESGGSASFEIACVSRRDSNPTSSTAKLTPVKARLVVDSLSYGTYGARGSSPRRPRRNSGKARKASQSW